MPAHCADGVFQPGLGETVQDCGGECGLLCSCGGSLTARLGELCSTGFGGNCDAGSFQCLAGSVECVASTPAIEVCDGLDNDCNGVADFPTELVDNDSDGYPVCRDCDDADNRAGICARNVILFIGDGMGPQQVRAGRAFKNGNTVPLLFEMLPYEADMTTASASSSVTDSAASATAMSTGCKVNNGVLSVALPGDGSNLQTVLELRKARGQSTGLITRYDPITGATPAAFGSHTPSRSKSSAIVGDLATGSRPNLLFGDAPLISNSPQFSGYTFVTTEGALLALDRSTIQSVFGEFGTSSPSLALRTIVALDILEEDGDGFFLMVEQANTDKQGHKNNLLPVLQAVLELEEAVGQALSWASGRTDTLIVVTADHETGGLSCSFGDYEATTAGELPDCAFTSVSHSGVNVPIFASGLGAEQVSGTLDNTDVYALTAGYAL